MRQVGTSHFSRRISSLKNQFSSCNLSWVRRVCNSATDGLRKWRLAPGSPVVFDVV